MGQKEMLTELSCSCDTCSTIDRNSKDEMCESNEHEYVDSEIKYTLPCAECGQDILYDQVHSLPVRCVFCDQIGPFQDYRDHLALHHSICNCEELIIPDDKTTLHIALHLSSFRLNDTSGINDDFSRTRDMKKELNNLIKNNETVTTNIQQMCSELIWLKNSLKRVSEECSSLRVTCQQQNSFIDQLNLAIKEQMEDFHHVSNDGTLIWKIDNFAQERNEAQSGQRLYIESPLFCSSVFGYKMRARLYLHGDGDAQGTHMSLYLVLLEGKHDAILQWPSSFQVTFCLFDQTGQNHHTDATWTNFQRPHAETSIASGIPNFFPLAGIEQEGNPYVREDTMFIKIQVDFDRTPRPLLPYTSSLNPALPTFVREAKRREKFEEYKRLRAALVETINLGNQEISQLGSIPATSSQDVPAEDNDE